MSHLFKSRIKKVFSAATLSGALSAGFFGAAAWRHNPQDEFHSGGVASLDFYVLVGLAFILVSGGVLLVGALSAYFISRTSREKQNSAKD